MWYIKAWNEMEIFLSFKSNSLAFVVLESFLGFEWKPSSSSFALGSWAPISDSACLGGKWSLCLWKLFFKKSHVAARGGFLCRVQRSVILNPSEKVLVLQYSRITTEFGAGFRTSPSWKILPWDPSLVSGAKQEVPAWKDRKQVAEFFSTASQK